MHGLEVESGRKWCGLASSWAFTTWSFFLPGKALQGVNRERERELFLQEGNREYMCCTLKST